MNPVMVIAFGVTVYAIAWLIADFLRMLELERQARDTLYRRWREWQR